jgi:hypothetical protein
MNRPCVDWKGLCAATMLEAGVTVVKHRGRDVVRVPYRDVRGAEVRTKIFAPNGHTWWSPVGVDQIPLGLETLPAPGEAARESALLLAEGESDALALRGELAELHGRRVCVLGVPGASNWQHEWRRFVAGFPLLYVLPDGDDAGARFAQSVVADVPWARVAWLPKGEDCRSLIQADCFDDLLELMAGADFAARLHATFRLAQTRAEFTSIWNGGDHDAASA